MAFLESFLANDDASEDGIEQQIWVNAPVVCVAVLMAGVVAGLMRICCAGGPQSLAGVPLPRCRWLNYTPAVVVSLVSLITGLMGLISAARTFILHWRSSEPLILVLAASLTYSFLFAALLIALLGRNFRGQGAPEVQSSSGQAAKMALMGGLAVGIATGVVAQRARWEVLVCSVQWRQACETLGASSGLLLLGLYTAQADNSNTAVSRGVDPSGPAGPSSGGGEEEGGGGGAECGREASLGAAGGALSHSLAQPLLRLPSDLVVLPRPLAARISESGTMRTAQL